MTWLDQPDWDSLAVALLHTLWQGALMAVVLALYLAFTPTARGNRRYLASVVVLGLVLLGGFVTWSALDYSRGARAPMSSQGDSAGLGQDRQLERNEARMSPEPVGAFENEATIERGVPGSSKAQVRSFDHGKWVLRFWLAGMALMLVRLGFQLKGAEAVGSRSRPAGAESVQTLFDELRDGMGLTRRAQLRIAEGLSTPVAMGVIWPLVILPTWLLTGTPPAMLRAILAHELAHVRRHDYLVNLGQLLIETVLFFNPAVWWISRQIRIEREACCDAEAARITGNQTEYAQALADFAAGAVESGAWPRAALAFGDRKSTGGLLDRIRRLVEPGYASRMRLPLRGLMVFLLTGAIALAALQQGTRLVVEAGGSLLTPKERIAKIEQIQESHAISNQEEKLRASLREAPDARVSVSGKVVIEGREGEIPEVSKFYYRAKLLGGGYLGVGSINKGVFREKLRPGSIYLTVNSSRFAPAIIGPFIGKPGGVLENLVIPLNEGFKTRFEIKDDQGRPIAGARISGDYLFGASISIVRRESDEHGAMELAHSAKGQLQLRIWADGFQHETKTFQLDSEATHSWALLPGVPTTLRVLSKEDGRPISGARICVVAASRTPENVQFGIRSGPQVAVSNDSGNAVVRQFRVDTIYIVIVDSAGHQPAFLGGIRAGAEGLEVKLSPALSVTGSIVGDLSKLRKRRFKGRAEPVPYVHYQQNPAEFGDNNFANSGFTGVDIHDGNATFEITNLWEGTVKISTGAYRRNFPLTASVTEAVIDLDAVTPKSAEEERAELAGLPRREVEIRLVAPPGHPAPRGKLSVHFGVESPGGSQMLQGWQGWHEVEIKDGVVKFAVPVGGFFGCAAGGVAGYWMPEINRDNVGASDQPLVVEATCLPAGAIYGTISETDGSPARGILIALVEVERAPGRPSGDLGLAIKNLAFGNDITERFMAGPLPIGGRYMIVASRGVTFVASQEILISEEKPIQEIRMKLLEGVDVVGELVDSAGRPLVGMSLSLYGNLHPSHGIGPGDLFTDRRGRFRFEGVNPDPRASYKINVGRIPGYQSASVAFTPGGKPVKIRLEKGHQVRGQILDAKTGWPVPGAVVYLIPKPRNRNLQGWIDADRETDENGRCLFSVLDDGEYSVSVHSATLVNEAGIVVRGGQAEEVAIRVNLSESSPLKPLKPE